MNTTDKLIIMITDLCNAISAVDSATDPLNMAKAFENLFSLRDQIQEELNG